MRVVVGTGGTAGHIFPALATADRLRERGVEVLFVGRAEGQEARLIPAAGFRMEPIEAAPLQRTLSLRTIAVPFGALRAARQARAIVRGAHAVLGMGGYVSVPVALAARSERLPLVVHEQNAVPGLANRAAARWAMVVALSFEEARRRFSRRTRTVMTGNPIRSEVAGVAAHRDSLSEEAIRELELDPARSTVVLFGGSQGAVRLDRAAVELAGLLRERDDLQLVLLTGDRHHDEVRRRLPHGGSLIVRTRGFLDRMELAYSVADLAIARAGATSIAELTACAIPAILVPYPSATGRHQELNARAVERAGGADVLLDDQVTGPALAARVSSLLGSPGRLTAMAKRAGAFGRPDAADALAGVVLSAGNLRR